MVLPEPRSWRVGAGATPVGPLRLVDADIAPEAARRLRTGWERLQPDRRLAEVVVGLHVDRPGPSLPAPDMAEDHRIEIGATGVGVHASTAIGARRAVETVLALAATGSLPWGVIEDAPRFRWRGLLVDVARQRIPLARLDQVVDAMAAAKLNVLHLHLSDDQAFRVQSVVHPRLHEDGSGGFWYTQDELRAFVHRAARAGIRVVPEFDVPGHTTSWLVAHPELAATSGPFELRRRAGIAAVGLRPDDPDVIAFLRALFAEMAGLFPDPYLHLGGDEVAEGAWPGVDIVPAQQRFTAAIVDEVLALGKVPVLWDEAWFPGLPAGVVTQVWRGHARFRAAAAGGHPVLFSTPYYLDLAFDPIHHRVDPLVDAAGWDAARAALRTDPRVGSLAPLMAAIEGGWDEGVDAPDHVDASAVLGGEACLWTELCPSHLLLSRLWPAAAVVAEVLWSGPASARPAAHDPERLDGWVHALAATTDVDPEGERLTLLLRLADGDPDLAGHLATLATCCEPIKWYARHVALPDGRIDGPFDRFADALEPAARAVHRPAPIARYRAAAEAVLALGSPDAVPARTGELVAVARAVLARCDAVEDPAAPWPGEEPVGEVLVVWPARPA